MRSILIAFATVVMIGMASCDDGSRREADDHNGREERPVTPVLPDGTHVDEEDLKQLADTSTRFSGLGVTLVYGEPGVLMVEDGESVVLRDLSEGGHYARFAVKVRGMELDGRTVGSNAVMIGEENGVQWWRAITEDKSRIYFVVSKY